MGENQRVLKAMVVDDDLQAVDYLAQFIHVTDDLELVAQTCNPRRAISLLKRVDVDVLFLDMEMPGLSGMQFMAQLKLIRGINPAISDMQVVVCTAYEHFAVKTYDYKVADYLIKPIFFDRYIEAIKEVRKRLLPVTSNLFSSDNKCFLIHGERGKNIYRVAFSDIIYLEANEQKTRLWVSDTKYYDIYMILKKLLFLLPKSQFVKVHRSYAISIPHFLEKSGKDIVLKNLKEKIPIGEYGSFVRFEDWLTENALKGKPVVKSLKRSENNE